MKNPIVFLMVEDSPVRAKRPKRNREQQGYRASVGYMHLLFRKLD